MELSMTVEAERKNKGFHSVNPANPISILLIRSPKGKTKVFRFLTFYKSSLPPACKSFFPHLKRLPRNLDFSTGETICIFA